MPTATVARVNKALAAKGFGAYEFVRGDGYHYFVGPDTHKWAQTTVYVCYTSHQSVERWVADFEMLRADTV